MTTTPHSPCSIS